MDGDCRVPAGGGRCVVLHADDFGMNAAVTQGILRGFSHGLLTSTAVLANAPGCPQALVAWKTMRDAARDGGLPATMLRRQVGDSRLPFDLGVHLNLTQGRPLTGARYPAELLCREGRFPGIVKLFRRLGGAESRYRAGIAAELKAQIEVVKDCGLAPTHLNGHQYVELLPGVSTIIPGLLGRYGIPVVRVAREPTLFRTTLLRRFQVANWFLGQIKRSFATRFQIDMNHRAVPHPNAFFGTAHAGRIDLGLMRRFLAGDHGPVTEIGLHPGLSPEGVNSAAVDPDDLIGGGPRLDSDGSGDPSYLPPAGAADDGWHDPLALRRSAELALLTSPELADLLSARGIRLGRLGELSRRAAA